MVQVMSADGEAAEGPLRIGVESAKALEKAALQSRETDYDAVLEKMPTVNSVISQCDTSGGTKAHKLEKLSWNAKTTTVNNAVFEALEEAALRIL